MEDIDEKLNSYDPGRTEHKTDVTKQLASIKVEREKMIQEHIEKETKYNETMNAIQFMTNPELLKQKFDNAHTEYKNLLDKNGFLKDKINTLKELTIFENRIAYIKPNDNLTPQLMLKLSTEYENYSLQLTEQNQQLENQIKNIINEKIQEKMRQKAGPTLTLKDDST